MRTFINFYWMFRAIKMDWSRYASHLWNPFVLAWNLFYHPGMMFSFVYRVERYLIYDSNVVFAFLGWLLFPVYYWFTYYVLSYHIEPKTKIDAGLMLHNREIVITENVTIGKYFTCMGQVTIGKNFHDETHIEIGNNVFVGTGAKIIGSGKLRIASGVVIGANGVVTKDLSKENGVYVGVPVKYLKQNQHKNKLASWKI